MAQGYLQKVKDWFLNLTLIICCSALTHGSSSNLSTFMQETNWTCPVLETEVSVLRNILQPMTTMQHSKPHLFEATFEETICTYFVRINCLWNEDSTVDFDLLSETLATMHSLNQNKPKSYVNQSVYLSLVPGIANMSAYHENLARINAIANVAGGVISNVLLDLSSVVVGPLDRFGLNQKLASCNEVGRAHSFKCGFIFDFQMCNFAEMSIFSHIRFPKYTRVFLNIRQFGYNTPFEFYHPSEVRTCLNTIFQSGLIVGGILDDENKIILNSTHFDIENLTPNRFPRFIPQRISTSSLQHHVSNGKCVSGHPKFYSNISRYPRISAIVSISSRDLYMALSDDVIIRANGPFPEYSFTKVFHWFLVIFPSIGVTNESSYANNDSVSIPELLTAILRYSETHKETYHLRPFQLWIAFTPKENIQDELETVMEYVNEINSKLPGTVVFVVLDYNNLRLDSSVVSVVKRDVEICNSHVNKSEVNCAYIFHSRNCPRNSKALEQLPFLHGSVVLLRGEAGPLIKCKTCIPGVQIGSIDITSTLTIKIDFESKLVTLRPDILASIGDSIYLHLLVATSDSTNYGITGSALYSDKWLHSPLTLPKYSIGFIVHIEDLSNKNLLALVIEHNNVLIRFNMLSDLRDQTKYLLSFCHSHLRTSSNLKVALIIAYHPRLNENLTTLNDIISEVSGVNFYCENVFTEILIEWDTCMGTSETCTKEDIAVGRSHFAGIANVTNYLKKINEPGLKIGWIFAHRTITDVLIEERNDFTSQERNFNLSRLGFQQFDTFLVELKLSLAPILYEGAFSAAMSTIEHFEAATKMFSGTLQQMHFHPNDEKEIDRFILRVIDCHLLNSTSWNETLEYARYWEILSNWGERMDVLLIMDTAYQSGRSNQCIRNNMNVIECACGWWTMDESSGRLLDRKSRGIEMMPEVVQRSSDSQSSLNLTSILSILGSLLMILIAAMSVPLAIYFYQKRYTLSKRVVMELLSELPSNVEPVVNMASRELIGRGSSKTCVYKCTLNTEKGQLDVAVKTFQSAPGEKLQTEDLMAIRGLISEAKTLRNLKDHPNVVKYLGICTAKLRLGELKVVLEYCPNGSLQKFLTTVFNPTGNKCSFTNHYNNGTELLDEVDTLLLRWSSEIANGLEYLASENVVHADIATRNILLDKEMRCKICDFGLSRRMEKYKSYVKTGEEPLPWRWMAPESLRKLFFNEKTDVWMYGVTLWEIYTIGQVPYGGFSWSNDFVRLLEAGLRLEIPQRMLPKVAQLLNACWDLNVENRPTFSTCNSELMNE